MVESGKHGEKTAAVIRWTYEQEQDDLGPTSYARPGGLGKSGLFCITTAGIILAPRATKILRPTKTRRAVSLTGDVMRVSSWLMAARLTKSKQRRHIGLIIFCGRPQR